METEAFYFGFVGARLKQEPSPRPDGKAQQRFEGAGGKGVWKDNFVLHILKTGRDRFFPFEV
jgi:hypothetical protein